ncbi:hypothetical protein [Oceaniglobus trochenteri]|uniref:hypothetical protein n=1 Tax=Oceaniglobus trochenteri TaxID=2763260 RepID=UPI001CFF85A6|nr:hypothetical protein [Oceaniglobus trochenteri]
MGAQQPLFASDRTAARLLDMRPAEFRALVAAGALPPPIRLHGYERWEMATVEAIMRGHAPKPKEDLEL